MSDAAKPVEEKKVQNAPPQPASSRSEHVVVGCKLPNGLILHCFVMETRREPLMGGGMREVHQARRLPETYTLNGNAMDVAKMAQGDVPHLIIGGYGVTRDIPREFWERWEEQNRDSDLVRGGFIFAVADEASARARAQDGAKLRSGLEPLDPASPGRSFPDVARVQKGTTAAA